MSLMKIKKNKSGPKLVSYGTPEVVQKANDAIAGTNYFKKFRIYT